MDAYAALASMHIELDPPPKAGGIYAPTVRFGEQLLYTSGNVCKRNGEHLFAGKVGSDVSLEEAQLCARQCVLNLLSNLHAALGDLNRIKKVVKVLGFVASAEGFYGQPQVMDAASQLLIDVFGEEVGRATRSAVGVYSLPGNVPVEIELLIELHN